MGMDLVDDGGEVSALSPKPLVARKWPQPDWQMEVVRDTRALWQIVVMAGNLAPIKATRDRRMKADGDWRIGYLKLLNVMKDALTSNPADTDRIYYNPDHAGNAERVKNPDKLSEVRVDTVSALKFIARCYGTEDMPAGMSQLLAFKQSRLPQPSSLAPEKAPPDHNRVALASSRRDQKLANATKTIKRLRALLFASQLWAIDKKVTSYREPGVEAEALDELKARTLEYTLYRVEGFGTEGLKTLTEGWLEAFDQMLDSVKTGEQATHHEPIN